jgi:hypothetical protein
MFCPYWSAFSCDNTKFVAEQSLPHHRSRLSKYDRPVWIYQIKLFIMCVKFLIPLTCVICICTDSSLSSCNSEASTNTGHATFSSQLRVSIRQLTPMSHQNKLLSTHDCVFPVVCNYNVCSLSKQVKTNWKSHAWMIGQQNGCHRNAVTCLFWLLLWQMSHLRARAGESQAWNYYVNSIKKQTDSDSHANLHVQFQTWSTFNFNKL